MNLSSSWYNKNKKHIPTLGSTLAPFRVWMRSPRLFLSPFIFQFPPTKNSLLMFAAFQGDLLGSVNGTDTTTGSWSSGARERTFRQRIDVFITRRFKPRLSVSDSEAPLVSPGTPVNASPPRRKGKGRMSCCVQVLSAW